MRTSQVIRRMRPAAFRTARAVLGTGNRPLARRRARRVLAGAPRPFALELGGRRARPGWVVTDVGATTRLYLDATSRWPIEDGALVRIYADNVIEHVSLEGARRLLAEAHRCLVPGGVLRLVTPDVGRHVEVYLSGRAAVDGPIADHYRTLGLEVHHPVDLVRIPIGSFGHHTGQVYDRASLEAELRAAGFTDVVACTSGASDHPELRGLERRGDDGGWQLVLEATR